MTHYPKIAQLKTVTQFRDRLAELQLALPVDETIQLVTDASPLAQPLKVGPFHLSNRWVVHPMEGWDANADGSPTEHTLRRWHNFGRSGASLIWGGEAAAVQPDGRANPRQTMAVPENEAGLAALLAELHAGHVAANQSATADDRQHFDSPPVVGLQLTHSGRFCRPHSKQLEPRIAYHHPLLD
ncbi:MAG: NADH:flavin oxidoreductase, partial [Planctomycetales bacterium]|nr:NADH:flavin oxidoreductase [Planctomycetales bacterium]